MQPQVYDATGNTPVQVGNMPQNKGVVNSNFTADANKTATPTEEANSVIQVSDPNTVLTAGRNYILPTTASEMAGPWTVNNKTGQTITFIGSSGTGIAVATTKKRLIYFDGTNMIAISADL